MAHYPLITWTFVVFHVVGILCAALAILRSRTPQGATAWVMALLSFPILSVPMYVVFGRSRFEGYNTKRRIYDAKVHHEFELLSPIDQAVLSISEEIKMVNATIPFHNQPGFTRKNSIKLLVDGQETYTSMLEELEKAQNYIVFQFYLFRYDHIGEKFAEVLMRKARQGVRVSFLYDEIGAKISKRYIKRMKSSGVKMGAFNRGHGRWKFQINFRNHRKIVVVDGKVGFVGGLNIGDEYLGLWKKVGPWRDTHVRITGPSVIAAQLATAKDWFCAREKILDVDWKIYPDEKADSNLLVLHTGPADTQHTCLLTYVTLINVATEKLWMANPYLVPPESIMDAIILAALRGVEVRILLPSYSDNRVVLMASKVYEQRLLEHGVKIFKYTKGFLHQKVMIIDSRFCCLGSANLDHRSMFVNFEILTISSDKTFIKDVTEMLINDFMLSEQVSLEDFQEQGLFKTIVSRGANLMAPIL